MELVIRNKIIDSPIDVILHTLKSELNNGKLKDILPENKDNIAVTCPSHKDGRESNPSCQVYTRTDNDQVEYGKVHCFTCGYTQSLPEFITDCFDEEEGFGEEWLLERFGTSFNQNARFLPEINLNKNIKREYLDESILKEFNYYHSYMWERKLTKEVVDKFHIGYDDKRKCIVFPVWDEKNNLVMLTSRSVINKSFYIDENKDKPVYLLNFINKENIKTVYVAESQINALTLWSWGYPAIALIGTGSYEQYNILNKSGIRNYILCFDGDQAGNKGSERFIKNIRNDVFVSRKNIPQGKDVNDLSKEEFDKLEEIF